MRGIAQRDRLLQCRFGLYHGICELCELCKPIGMSLPRLYPVCRDLQRRIRIRKLSVRLCTRLHRKRRISREAAFCFGDYFQRVGATCEYRL